jgi:hypothetical protein
LVEEANSMKVEIEKRISELATSIPEDKEFAEKQVEVKRINAQVAELEVKIEALTKQAKEKREERAQEMRKHEIEGVKNFQKLLEVSPFEQIAKITGMIHQYRKKVADMMLAKKEMDQTRDKVARFYEEVLEVDNAKKLPAHKFETVINIEQEYDSKVFASLAEVIDRCDMMQKQAKEIEKESSLLVPFPVVGCN